MSEPTILADLLPMIPGLQVVTAVHVAHERVVHERIDPQHAIVENNLARKGVWSTDPDRSSGPTRDVLRIETEDVVGQLIMESSMGRLSTTEMELVSWVFARWMGQRERQDAFIHTSLREIAEAFETVWGGSRARFIKDMLRRIHGVRFDAEVQETVTDKKTGKPVTRKTTKLFNIFDYVDIVEYKDEMSRVGGPRQVGEGTVRVKIGEFMHQQLLAGQYRRYDWHILRRRLTSPLAKRLYVYIDSHRGRKVEGGLLYERTIDDKLLVTLGIRDRNRSRAIAKLRTACAQIQASEPTYKALEVRRSADRANWVLSRLKEDNGTHEPFGLFEDAI